MHVLFEGWSGRLNKFQQVSEHYEHNLSGSIWKIVKTHTLTKFSHIDQNTRGTATTILIS